jgi:hypothetical protein
MGLVVAQLVTSRPTINLGHLALVDRAYAYRQREKQSNPPPSDWQGWLTTVFGSYVRPPFASYHAEFWQWVWNLEAGTPSDPFVAIWPRGFGKSTAAEIACAAVAARGTRTYVLYIMETQDQADTHVQNVAALLESKTFAQHYPHVGARKVGKYGNSMGWRRNRLRTESGFILDAIGLDTAARGAKVDEDRPDLIIGDDLDGLLDSPGTTTKKIETLTKSLIPARAAHAAVLIVQNLIHADGIVAQLADGRADFLANRKVSGPHPALVNAAYDQGEDGKWRIVAGEPTWEAMGIPELQAELDDIGISAFRSEKQHETDQMEGGIFGQVIYRHCASDEVPPLDRIVVWVDPAVTDTDKSDAHGIQADGLARDGTIYRLYSWEDRTSPENALRRAILKAIELGAEAVGVETDQGGDTWQSVYDRVWDDLVASGMVPQGTRKPQFRQDKAGAGHGPKAQRASQMLVDYVHAKIVHVVRPGANSHELLERALKRYLIRKPYDLVDAAYWSWYDLRKGLTGQLAWFVGDDE